MFYEETHILKYRTRSPSTSDLSRRCFNFSAVSGDGDIKSSIGSHGFTTIESLYPFCKAPFKVKDEITSNYGGIDSSLRGQKMTTQQSNNRSNFTLTAVAPLSCRDKDGSLVAMGTNCNPPPGGFSGTLVRTSRPSSLGNTSTSNSSTCNLTPVAGRKFLTQSRTYSQNGLSYKGCKTSFQECHYQEPCPGGPPTFQQRIAEITALEQETIRWEKSKKLKKKLST